MSEVSSQLNDMEKCIVSAVTKQLGSTKADGPKDDHAGNAFGGKQSVKRARFNEE